MKNQYIGDIGDYGKYGLLRYIAQKGIRIGINWYLTPDDKSNDGKLVSFLQDAAYRVYDPQLYDFLKRIAYDENKSVAMIKDNRVIPDADYYAQPLNSSNLSVDSREWDRRLWFNNSMMLLGDADLIFADPDNGLIGKKSVKSKNSEKYVMPLEIAEYYNAGKNVVYYCHKGRRKQEDWEKAKLYMKQYLMDAQLLVLTYHKGTQRSYIFVVHPDDYKKYARIISDFCRTRWGRVFSRESVGGDEYDREQIGDAFEVELSDGAVMKMVKKVDGKVWITSSNKPNQSLVMTPDQLARWLWA